MSERTPEQQSLHDIENLMHMAAMFKTGNHTAPNVERHAAFTAMTAAHNKRFGITPHT